MSCVEQLLPQLAPPNPSAIYLPRTSIAQHICTWSTYVLLALLGSATSRERHTGPEATEKLLTLTCAVLLTLRYTMSIPW